MPFPDANTFSKNLFLWLCCRHNRRLFCPVEDPNCMPRDPAQLKQTEAPCWDTQLDKCIVSLHSIQRLGWQRKGVRAPSFYEHSVFTVLDPVINMAGARFAFILLHDKPTPCFSSLSFNGPVYQSFTRYLALVPCLIPSFILFTRSQIRFQS